MSQEITPTSYDTYEEYEKSQDSSIKIEANQILSNFSKFLLIYGTGIIFFCFSLFAVSFFTLLLNFSLSSFQFYAGSALTLGFTVWSARQMGLKSLVGAGAFVLIAVSVVGSIGISRQFYDMSNDGQGYHSAAINKINEGWNPLYDSNPEKTSPWSKWYPKGLWYAEVNIYKLTGVYNDIKAFTIITSLASLAILLSLTQFIKINKFFYWLIALVLSFNSIFFTQVFSLNLDSVLTSFLMILSVMIFLKEKFSSNYTNLVIAMIGLLLINFKTAGLVFFVFFYCGYLLYLFLTKSKNLRSNFSVFLTIIFAGTCIFGYNPYVTNFRAYSNPLYPFLSSGVYNFDENIPSNYLKTNKIELFTSSLFFKSDGIFSGDKDIAVMKLPFTFESKELTAFFPSNPKKGGFGPLFSGSLVAVLVGLLLLFLTKMADRKNITKLDKQIVIASLVILLSCVSVSYSNMARYIAHFLILIAIWQVYLLYQKNIIFKLFSIVSVLVLLANTGLVAGEVLSKNYETSQETRNNLQYISQNFKNQEVLFLPKYHIDFTKIILKEQGVDSKWTVNKNELNCKKPQILLSEFNDAVYCKPTN